MKRWFVASFDSPEALREAAWRARDLGWRVVDAATPCPVHGLDEALGLRPSRLPWVCFLGGLAGAVFMMWFQHWTSAVDWRLNVGGRPWNSSLSFACVAFEVTVLCAGLGSVAALLAAARLWPGRTPRLLAAGVTDDRFALVLEETDQRLGEARIAAELGRFGPIEVTETVGEADR